MLSVLTSDHRLSPSFSSSSPSSKLSAIVCLRSSSALMSQTVWMICQPFTAVRRIVTCYAGCSNCYARSSLTKSCPLHKAFAANGSSIVYITKGHRLQYMPLFIIVHKRIIIKIYLTSHIVRQYSLLMDGCTFICKGIGVCHFGHNVTERGSSEYRATAS